MDIACPVRDIACIKPTIENTDPAFAVGMQASCLFRDYAHLWHGPDETQTLVAQSCKEDTDLVDTQGFSIHALHGTAGILL